MEFLLHCQSFVKEMLLLLLSHPLSAPCQYFSDVVVVCYLLLLVLRLFHRIYNTKSIGSLFSRFPLLGAYMHHTLNTSLIYFNTYPIHSNFHQNIQNYSKIFFLLFLYFYSRLFECSSIFLSYVLYEGLYFASTSRFDSELRSAYQLVGSTRQVGCPPT